MKRKEAKLKLYIKNQAKSIHELMCLMCIIIFPFFAFFDLQTIRKEYYWQVTTVRLSISLVMLIWLLIQKKYKTNELYLTLFSTCSVTWFCCWACVLGQNEFLYQQNLACSTIFLAASLFLLWHYIYSIIVVISAILSYIIFVLNYQHFSIEFAIMEGGSTLLSMMLLHPVIIYFRYNSYKRECFLKNKLIESNAELHERKEKSDLDNLNLKEARISLKVANEQLSQTNQELENQVKIRTQTLENTNLELEKALSDLDRFLYISYHDIKGPIARLRGLANLLKSGNENINLNDLEKRFKKTLDEMELLISKLAKLNEISKLKIKPESIDLLDFFENIIESKFLNKNNFELKIPQNLYINTDRYILSFTINLLIENSFKFADTSRELKILVLINNKKNNIELVIQDNGLGIDQDLLDKIFVMFYRGNEKSSGMGLGLYFVKKSLEKISAKVEIESKVDEFTRVKILIPNL